MEAWNQWLLNNGWNTEFIFFSSKPKNSGQLGSNEDTAKIAIDERLVRKYLEQLNIYK